MKLDTRKRPHVVKGSKPSFLSLPAEVRNMVYHLALVVEEPLEIQDMHIQEFQNSKRRGQCRLRSKYSAPDHASRHCPFSPEDPWGRLYTNVTDCSLGHKDHKFQDTTYILRKTAQIKKLMLAILSLNRQVRLEAFSVFYGINTFSFTTMSSLIPFFKDRSPETRQYIFNVHLNLTIYLSDWYSVTTAYNRPNTWKKAFTSLAKMQHVSLKNVCVSIKDQSDKIYVDDLDLQSKHMQWLHSLSRITKLEKLGVAYQYGQWGWERGDRSIFYYPRAQSYPEIDSQTEQEIWAFLAPKMLKAPGDDTSALLERRIWDFEADPEADEVLDQTGNNHALHEPNADWAIVGPSPASSISSFW